MEQPKDIKRFSYSRLNIYNQCPRKHYYMYDEKIPSGDNKFMLIGKLFHECLDKYYKGLDIREVFNRYASIVRTGMLDGDEDLLEYVFTRYLNFWKASMEKCIASEFEYTDDLEDGDQLKVIIDRIIETPDEEYILRDTKTTINNLKYGHEDVKTNQQLLLYVPFAENSFNIVIDQIEVDEVRVAKLEDVPLTTKGVPSIDKSKLGLVTYEDYIDKLMEMGLQNKEEYKNIIDYLEKRGHPLFRRVNVQVLDKNLVNNNLQDVYDSYHGCKTMGKQRVKGYLCQYCPYKDLCNLDLYSPDDADRQILIDKIISNK